MGDGPSVASGLRLRQLMTGRMPPAGAHGAQTLPTLSESRPKSAPPFRDVYARSETGHVREANEDHFLILDVQRRMRVRGSSLGATGLYGDTVGMLLVVADGMGGHDHGELASAVAIDTIADFAARELPVDPGYEEASARSHAGFQRAVRECQRRIHAAAQRKGASMQAGTTMTALYAQEGVAEIAHVGDSRAYLFRPGSGLWMLTHDHTFGAQIEEATGEPAERVAHILTNAIGGTEEEPRVEALHVPLFADDRVLLCSDGLTDVVDDATLGAELGHAQRAQGAVERLMARVLDGEARDNVTIMVAIV